MSGNRVLNKLKNKIKTRMIYSRRQVDHAKYDHKRHQHKGRLAELEKVLEMIDLQEKLEANI